MAKAIEWTEKELRQLVDRISGGYIHIGDYDHGEDGTKDTVTFVVHEGNGRWNEGGQYWEHEDYKSASVGWYGLEGEFSAMKLVRILRKRKRPLATDLDPEWGVWLPNRDLPEHKRDGSTYHNIVDDFAGVVATATAKRSVTNE